MGKQGVLLQVSDGQDTTISQQRLVTCLTSTHLLHLLVVIALITGLEGTVLLPFCRWTQVTAAIQETQYQDVKNVPLRLL